MPEGRNKVFRHVYFWAFAMTGDADGALGAAVQSVETIWQRQRYGSVHSLLALYHLPLIPQQGFLCFT